MGIMEMVWINQSSFRIVKGIVKGVPKGARARIRRTDQSSLKQSRAFRSVVRALALPNPKLGGLSGDRARPKRNRDAEPRVKIEKVRAWNPVARAWSEPTEHVALLGKQTSG